MAKYNPAKDPNVIATVYRAARYYVDQQVVDVLDTVQQVMRARRDAHRPTGRRDCWNALHETAIDWFPGGWEREVFALGTRSLARRAFIALVDEVTSDGRWTDFVDGWDAD